MSQRAPGAVMRGCVRCSRPVVLRGCVFSCSRKGIDDGVGLVYRGTELIEAVADRPDTAAYRVERGPDGSAVETRIEPRRLA